MTTPATHLIRAAATSLAALAALAAAGCDKNGSDSGTVTITQTPTTSTTATTTSSVNSHAINDKTKLCRLFASRGTEITNAVDDLNRTVDHDNWSWTEPKISAAGDKVVETTKKSVSILTDAIGPGIEKSVADVMHEYLKAVADYSTSVEERTPNAEVKPFYDSLVKAEDDINAACGFGK